MTFVRNILFDTLVLTGNYTCDGKIVINSISQVINTGISQESVKYITF